MRNRIFLSLVLMIMAASAQAATTIPLTVNLSETVTVTGTPRIAVDVGGTTRYAAYSSGSGTNVLTFTLSPQAGDVDLDGITVSSPIDLNGGSIKDTAGNDATLTFTPPNTTGIKIDYPSLSMDFVTDADGRYTLNGTAYNDLTSFLSASGGTFSRASVGTYYDSTGVLQTASSGTPRFDWDPVTHAAKGILIEESRTNSIRNSEATGVSVPSTFPTYWATNSGGATWTIVGSGTANGLRYIDARISGTLTSPNPYIDFESVTYIPASSGQTWTASAYIQLLAGTTSAGAILIRGGTSGAAFIESGGTQIPTYAGTLTRYTTTHTLTQASTQRVSFRAIVISAIGNVIDVTLRIAAPQLEQGSFPTSYIPTTSAAVTRAADNLQIPSGGWLSATQGSVYSEALIPSTLNGPSSSNTFWSLDDATTSNFILGRVLTNTASELAVKVGGVNQVNKSSVLLSAGSTSKVSTAYQLNDFAIAVNANTAATTASGTLPTMTALRFGQVAGINFLNSTISRLKYYPTRLANTQLQLLTQ